ncbi:PH domain-containing protein, partial [Lentimicrobium sp.]
FYKKTFDLMSLQSIRPTSNPLSSPALSLKRLELRFRNRETIMISPVKQEEFIELLKSINPEIELKKR